MHTFVQELGLFLWAVIAHWQSYVTGGVVTAVVTVYERKTHHVLPWKYYALIFLISGGLVAVFYAWHDEHRNAQVLIDQKAEVYGLLGTCNGHLEAQTEKANFLDAQNHTQQQAINAQQQTLTAQQETMNSQQQTANSQQGAMNSCVVALGKANTPEPQTIVMREHGVDLGTTKAKREMEVLMLTNKTITPVHLQFGCQSEVRDIQAYIAGAGMQAGGNRMLGTHGTEISISTPAWTPQNPLIITVYYDSDDIGTCGYRLM